MDKPTYTPMDKLQRVMGLAQLLEEARSDHTSNVDNLDPDMTWIHGERIPFVLELAADLYARRSEDFHRRDHHQLANVARQCLTEAEVFVNVYNKRYHSEEDD